MMEMPEGYKNLFHQITHQYDAYGCLDENMITAINLMKEMAEALESFKNKRYYTSNGEIIGPPDEINVALEKFRNWK